MRRSLVEVLTNPDHGDALRGFLQAWHGVELPAVEATPQVPALLGSLLALGLQERITYFNRAFEPEVVADGLLLFASEYEGVYHWAYRPGEPDPIVWGRFPNWKDQGSGKVAIRPYLPDDPTSWSGATRPRWSRPGARFQRRACSGIGADRAFAQGSEARWHRMLQRRATGELGKV